MTRDQPILAVDVCGTLYDTNTTAGLVIFHHARRGHRWRHALLSAISCERGATRMLLVSLAKLTRFDLHRALVLASLRGESLTALRASAIRYVADHLPRHAIPATHARLGQMRAAGWHPILVSNAVNPVIEEIARHLDLPCISSQLKVRSGRLTGRLARDLTGRKRGALEARLSCDLSTTDFAVITDNRSDKELVTLADPAILVAPRTPRNWMRGLDAEILCY